MQTQGYIGDDAPLYAPCRKLSLGAPFRWLKLGWQDFRRVPLHSLSYGVLFALIGWLLLYFAWIRDNDALVFSLLFGFLIVGPILSFGLYDISNQLEQNRKPSFRHERSKAFHEMGHELMFGLMLVMLFLILTILVSMVMWTEPTPAQLSVSPALTVSALAYVSSTDALVLAVIFAAVVFCASAFALPMILHRDVDAMTALVTSVNAVMRNLRVSALWALLIFVLVAAGFATALIGLVFVVPLLGYASWHAYREAIITGE
jgi:uncharacterized membrane protein